MFLKFWFHGLVSNVETTIKSNRDSETSSSKQAKASNGLHDKSVDVLMKGKIWLKSNGANAVSVTIPDSLIQLS